MLNNAMICMCIYILILHLVVYGPYKIAFFLAKQTAKSIQKDFGFPKKKPSNFCAFFLQIGSIFIHVKKDILTSL